MQTLTPSGGTENINNNSEKLKIVKSYSIVEKNTEAKTGGKNKFTTFTSI